MFDYVRVRFAPSPTGYLHIGGVRTALFNYLFAKRHRGDFILRIDDTDSDRHLAEAIKPILEGLEWLGINWDEGAYFQSERTHLYRAAVELLLARGFAYQDFGTKEEIETERKISTAANQPWRYSRKWAAETPEQIERFRSEGRQCVVRLKMPRTGQCVYHDMIRGTMAFNWEQEQDHVIMRTDGSIMYHLASVVDDHDLEISHVIRAEEHLSNTPRQVWIAQGLQYQVPRFAHLSCVNAPNSTQKLSKRHFQDYMTNDAFSHLQHHGQDIAMRLQQTWSEELFNPVAIDFYRIVGYLPDAILNYVLLLGWSYDDKQEIFDDVEMVKNFSLDRIATHPAQFNPAKLWSVQEHYMKQLTTYEKVYRCLPFMQSAGLVDNPPSNAEITLLAKVVRICGDRLKVAGDILTFGDFFFTDKLRYEAKAVDRHLRADKSRDILKRVKLRLRLLLQWTSGKLEATIKDFAEKMKLKVGDIVQPLRVAISGRAVGPGLYESLQLLGQKESLNRIDQSLTWAEEHQN